MPPDEPRQSLPDQSVRPYPVEPEYRNVLRARVVLDFSEQGERVHEAADGWARLDGPWLHWLPDDDDRWQTWPMHNVVCVDWLEVLA